MLADPNVVTAGIAPTPVVSTAIRDRAIRRRRLARGALYAAVITICSLWLIPLLASMLTAVRSFDDVAEHGVAAFPRSFTLTNFAEAWTSGRLGRYFLSTLIITVPSVILVLALGSAAAFVLVGRHVPLSRTLMLVFLAGNLLPPQILLYPVFELVNDLGIYDTYWALIAIHVGFQLGFAVFVFYNFMQTIPGEVIEAAHLDGATPWVTYRRFVLPLSRPAIAALGTLQFTWIFNDYLWAVVLVRDTNRQPITTGLTSLRGEYVTAWNVLSAGTLLAAVPTLIVFVLLQRHFVAGLLVGTSK